MQITASLPKATSGSYAVYEILGGDEGGAPEAFAELVHNFYAGIENEPLLRPMYPEDLSEAKENMTLFLVQYFGGPALYAEKRGHPRLRMRHGPFVIGPAERDAWLSHMLAALHSVPALAPVAETMRAYFVDAANFLVNRPDR